MKKLLVIVGALLGCGIIAVMVYGLFFASAPSEIPSVLIGKPAEPFTLTTFKGETITLEQFRGKPVVLNFWASWCVACRQEARLLEAANKEYTPQGAVFIGIAINDTREASLQFIRRYGKTYYLGPDDEMGTISLNYGVTAVPETFLINRQGIIEDKVVGPVSHRRLQTFVEEQLK